jgi:hypothetical protein
MKTSYFFPFLTFPIFFIDQYFQSFCLILINFNSRKEIYDSSRVCPEGAIPAGTNSPTPAVLEKKEKRWRIGGMEFEALMRMLDNAVSSSLTNISCPLKYKLGKKIENSYWL